MERALIHVPEGYVDGLTCNLLNELMWKIDAMLKETRQQCIGQKEIIPFYSILNMRFHELAATVDPALIRIADHALYLHQQGDEVYLFEGKHPLPDALNKFNKIFSADESVFSTYKNERENRSAPNPYASLKKLSAVELNRISIQAPGRNIPHIGMMIAKKDYSGVPDFDDILFDEDSWTVFLSKDTAPQNHTPVSMLDPDMSGCQKLEPRKYIRHQEDEAAADQMDLIEKLGAIPSISRKVALAKVDSTIPVQKNQSKGPRK